MTTSPKAPLAKEMGAPGLCPLCRDEDGLEEHLVALVQLILAPPPSPLLMSRTDAKPQLWLKSVGTFVFRVGFRTKDRVPMGCVSAQGP